MTRHTTALFWSLALVSLTANCGGSTGSADPGSGGKSASGGGPASSGSGGTGTSASGGSSSGGNGSGGSGSGGTVVIATGGAGQSSGGSSSGGSGGMTSGRGGGAGSVTTGSGGATATGGAGGAAPAADCPSGAVFCDDFETYTAMAAPPMPKWKSWTVGAGTVLVDTAHPYSGTKAAHFHGKVSQSGGSKEQAFMLAQGAPVFPVSGNTLYVRFMMYGTRMPFTGVTTSNHIAIAWVGSAKGLNAPDQGETGKGYLLADYNGVSIEPMWMGYFRDTSTHFKDTNQANKWHCWEFEIDNAGGPPPGATGAALPHIWEDGVALKLAEGGGSAPYNAAPFEAVLFSLWSPQTDTSAADYWIDDIAISKSRINCPAAK